jgi:hypothetical protein
MKLTINFFAIISAIFFNSICNAQTINTPEQWLIFQQNELKNCPYVFEGKIIQQSKKGKATCSVLQITKIYRGDQLNIGTIKVVTTIATGAEKFPQLHKDNTYIIFGNLSNSTLFKSVASVNTLTLWSNDWVVFQDTGAEWGWRKKTNYKTVDDLYSFFKENGLIVKEEVQQQSTTPTDSTTH